MNSLRAQLILFWVILVTVCVALGLIMLVLFRGSAGLEIEAARAHAETSCSAIATRYAKSLADPQGENPQLDLLQVLLQLVLIEEPHVEGGVWQAKGGFLSYAYPTYEGSGVKRDVPEAEQAHIAEIAQVAARTGKPQTDVVRGSREALVVSACPLHAPREDLAAWTMTRTSLAILDAQRSLRLGLGALLGFVLASAIWLGTILVRGERKMRRLEAQLAQADDSEAASPLARTDVRELDRVVEGLNRYRERFEKARAQLREVERERSRDQRLTALGRMTGSIAHEIRNPIATMRLKAENALAGSASTQPQALRVILDQVARLDSLVQSLLSLVQPLTLQPRPLELADWAAQRLSTVQDRAALRHVHLDLQAEPLCAELDATHLERAVDNLLDNAVRHAAPGGRVRLSVRRLSPSNLAIAIEDDGEGVPPELEGRLFEPFATGRPDGTGLGLALAREVALAHGGDLTYIARPEGGARFEMELPWRVC